MLKLEASQKTDCLGANNPPAARCNSGDTVIFSTTDCFDGAVCRDGSVLGGRFMSNPVTGPLYVEGAKPGDALKVEILRLTTRGWGAMGTGFGEGAFKSFHGKHSVHVFEFADGFVTLAKNRIPVRPMIGVIGVAPEGDAIPSVTPGAHGGNMDCNRIVEGSVIYFPVSAPGALLSMGDMHALMGDGEVFGYGLETSGEATVRVTVLDGMKLTQPLLYEGDDVMCVASADTLENASRLALEAMYTLLLSRGHDATEAGLLMSMKCDLAICQIVDPLVTVRAELEKRLL